MDTIEWAIAHQDDRVPWSNLSKDRLDRLIFVLGDMRLAPGGSDGSCDDFAIEALFGRDLGAGDGREDGARRGSEGGGVVGFVRFSRCRCTPRLEGGDELSFGMELAEPLKGLEDGCRMMRKIVVHANALSDAAELLAPLHAAKL